MRTFEYRTLDILTAPRLALRSANIKSGLFSLLTGYLGYLLLAAAGMVVSGFNPITVWLIPAGFPTLPPLSVYSVPGIMLFFTGLLIFFHSVLSGMTASSRIAFESLADNPFLTAKEGLAFAGVRRNSISGIPLIFLFSSLASAFAVILIGFAGRLPAGGGLITAVFFFPAVILSLLSVFFLVMVLSAVLFLPAVLGVSDETAPEIIAQLFALVIKQPFALLLYQILGTVVYTAAFIVSASTMMLVIKLTFLLISGGMGDKFVILASGIYQFLHNAFSMHPFLAKLELLYYSLLPDGLIPFFGYGIPATINWSAYLIFLLFNVSLAALLSYWMSVFTSGQVIIYLILRRRIDGAALVEKKKKESEIPPLNFE